MGAVIKGGVAVRGNVAYRQLEVSLNTTWGVAYNTGGKTLTLSLPPTYLNGKTYFYID